MSQISKIDGFCKSKHMVTAGLPILDAIRQLTEAAPNPQFLIVVDADGKLVGTLTDGDIRRSILVIGGLVGNVRDFMQAKPIYACIQESAIEKHKKLQNTKSTIKFLPILNVDRTVAEILWLPGIRKSDMTALIMAGGFGTRLGNITANKPKALVELNDLPLIESVLKKVENSGFKNVFISVHYLGKMIEKYVAETGRDHFVTILYEDEPLGTAGAIGLLSKRINEDLLVTNCDVVTNLQLTDMKDFFNSSLSDASIAVAQHNYTIPFGVVRSSPSGQVLSIDEKPVVSSYVSAGIYCFTQRFVERVSASGRMDMPQFIERGIKLGMSVSIFPVHEEWADVGTIDQLNKMNELDC